VSFRSLLIGIIIAPVIVGVIALAIAWSYDGNPPKAAAIAAQVTAAAVVVVYGFFGGQWKVRLTIAALVLAWIGAHRLGWVPTYPPIYE
jgi:hypothetical protein